ncbi:hypothetical protein [Lysobacter soli]|uniref:hypothetical protein n=1 Tax=Lysobacter soli TaxID=453783 RepID=UPI0018DDA3D7|nr:hypothetical protein [Lysobacter soli]
MEKPPRESLKVPALTKKRHACRFKCMRWRTKCFARHLSHCPVAKKAPLMALKVSPVPLQVPTVTKKASRVAHFSLLPSQKSAIAGTSSADVVARSANAGTSSVTRAAFSPREALFAKAGTHLAFAFIRHPGLHPAHRF